MNGESDAEWNEEERHENEVCEHVNFILKHMRLRGASDPQYTSFVYGKRSICVDGSCISISGKTVEFMGYMGLYYGAQIYMPLTLYLHKSEHFKWNHMLDGLVMNFYNVMSNPLFLVIVCSKAEKGEGISWVVR